MKCISKVVFSLLSVFTFIIVEASPIDEPRARQMAICFFSQRNHETMDDVRITLDKPQHTSRNHVSQASTCPFYIYNRDGGGYVIISSDDRLSAVLGYSDNGFLSSADMPENMRWWLDEYQRQLEGVTDSIQDDDHWDVPRKGEGRPPVSPMLTTLWGQRMPYNNQTPLVNGQHALTGCVATALAQIMNYSRWPESVNAIPAYDISEQLPPTTFRWEQMLDSYHEDSSQESQDAVAELMRYAGQAVMTAYGSSGSSASMIATRVGCYNYLRFYELKILRRKMYTDEAWEDSIYNSLQAGTPVFYRGEPQQGTGHAFVCDGYENGFFHFNWGWEGSANGYFLLSALRPTASSDYSLQQAIITGLHRPARPEIYDSNSPLAVTDMAFSAKESPENCLTRVNGAFEGLFVYDTRELFVKKNIAKTEMALMLYQDTLPLRLVSDIQIWPSRNMKPMTNKFTVNFGEDLPDGSYQVLAVSRKAGDDKWEKEFYAYVNGLNVLIDGSKMSISSNLKPIAVVDMRMSVKGEHKQIEVPTRPGEPQIKLFGKLTNNNSDKHELETAIEISSDDDSIVCVSGQRTLDCGGQLLETVISFDQMLTDGQYWLKGVYKEKGALEWMEMLNAEEYALSFFVEDGTITFPEEDEVRLSSLAFHLDDMPYETFFTTVFPRDSISHRFENIRVSNTLSHTDNKERCIDHALVLTAFNESESPVALVVPCYCTFVEAPQDGGTAVFTVNDTLCIDNSLPDGHYVLQAIARDASREEWLMATPNQYGSCLHLFIKGDSLTMVPDYEYNLRNVKVGPIVFRNHKNDYNYWIHLQNHSEYQAFGNVHLSYFNEYNEPEDFVYTLTTASVDSMELNIVHPINSEYTVSVISEDAYELGRDEVTPRHENMVLNSIGVFSVDYNYNVSFSNSVLFDIQKERAMDDESIYVRYKCLDDATIVGNVTLENYPKGYSSNRSYYVVINDTTYRYYCRSSSITDENSFRDWIGKRSCVEVGYMSNWNEYTGIGCSEEFTPEGFVVYYVFDEEKSLDYGGRMYMLSYIMNFSDTVVVPDDALMLDLTNVYANRATIVPNQNPNCLYKLNGNDSIPVPLRGHPIMLAHNRVDSLTIVDGHLYFGISGLQYRKLSYQRTFEADKWTTVAIPFPMKEDSWGTDEVPELYQLTYRNGSFVMEPFTYNYYLWTYGKMAVVKGNGKCVNILANNYDNPDYKCSTYSFSSWNMDRFTVISSCFPRHYDAFYELSGDGKELVLKSGDILPYRTYLIPNTDYRPERIRVWLPGETPTSTEDIHGDNHLRVVNRYALDGRKVDADYKGVTILQYNDGTTRKVMATSQNP